MIDDPGQSLFLGVAALEEIGTHHGRKRECYKSGYRHGAGEGEGEFAKQRAGKSALESDRGINRRQGDGHRNNRSHQFSRPEYGRIDRRVALPDVTFHVLHHHDRIVDHDTDGQNNRE